MGRPCQADCFRAMSQKQAELQEQSGAGLGPDAEVRLGGDHGHRDAARVRTGEERGPWAGVGSLPTKPSAGVCVGVCVTNT